MNLEFIKPQNLGSLLKWKQANQISIYDRQVRSYQITTVLSNPASHSARVNQNKKVGTFNEIPEFPSF